MYSLQNKRTTEDRKASSGGTNGTTVTENLQQELYSFEHSKSVMELFWGVMLSYNICENDLFKSIFESSKTDTYRNCYLN